METQTGLHRVLNPGVLDNVLRFWFQHIADGDRLIVPDEHDALVWFSQDDSSKFGVVLDDLSTRDRLTAEEILDAARPKSALEWMSRIILLDQIPRNCYRGEDAGIAYSFLDPLALDIAFQAIAAGIPERPELRYKHSYRFWFYLPLEHSENLHVLSRIIKEHDKMFHDSRELIDAPDGPRESESLCCRQVLRKRRQQFKIWETTLRGIAKDHMDLIERFGCYPHRNRALDRESTEEELEHLRT